MVIACWSVKGGSGTTVVASCLAVVAARVTEQMTLLVDLAGDAPAALGVDQPSDGGVADWLAAARTVVAPGGASWTSIDAGRGATDPGQRDLEALESRVDDRLSVLARGARSVDAVPVTSGALLSERLSADGRIVVVDAGTRAPEVDGGVTERVIADADRSLLVIRPCYLALRHVARNTRRIDGVIVVTEPGRSLAAADVASVTGAPVVAQVPCEPQIARVVDAGLLCSRVPRNVERALSAVVGD
jgi:MinD superfamily P-loop ATPase